jgi:hypothetical protein
MTELANDEFHVVDSGGTCLETQPSALAANTEKGRSRALENGSASGRTEYHGLVGLPWGKALAGEKFRTVTGNGVLGRDFI